VSVVFSNEKTTDTNIPRGQATQIVVDARGQAGMTQEIAEQGIRRAYGADNKLGGKIYSIRVIGPGFDITVPRVP
jgi:filamentous hemagglutinin